jgi:hypothetical protein
VLRRVMSASSFSTLSSKVDVLTSSRGNMNPEVEVWIARSANWQVMCAKSMTARVAM